MAIPALLGLAAVQGLSSLASGIGRAKQDARTAAMLADRERLAREQTLIERAQMQRIGQAGALGSRLDYLTGAQSDQSRLAAQRLAAMDLGKIQEFEELMARRAAPIRRPVGVGSPLARAAVEQQGNLLSAIDTDRYRESVSEDRTRQSLEDYQRRVDELRRDPSLDAESRAALDRYDALMAQELPGISTQASSPGSSRGAIIAAILGAGAAGAGAYFGGRAMMDGGGGNYTFNNRGPNYGSGYGLSGPTTGPTGMPTGWRLPRAEFGTSPTSPSFDLSRYYQFGG